MNISFIFLPALGFSYRHSFQTRQTFTLVDSTNCNSLLQTKAGNHNILTAKRCRQHNEQESRFRIPYGARLTAHDIKASIFIHSFFFNFLLSSGSGPVLLFGSNVTAALHSVFIYQFQARTYKRTFTSLVALVYRSPTSKLTDCGSGTLGFKTANTRTQSWSRS